MNILYFILFILLISNIISISIYLKERKKLNKERKKIEDEADKQAQKRFEQLMSNEWERKRQKLVDEFKKYESEQKAQIDLNLSKEKEIAELKLKNLHTEVNGCENQLAQMKENSNKVLKEYEDKVKVEIEVRLNEKKVEEFDKIVSEIEAFLNCAAEQKNYAQEELNTILSQLDEYKLKREAINREILRQRELEEKQDFYIVNLDEKTLHDLTILEEIKPQLSKLDFLDKFIYDIYINKPVNEMIKRVLEGNSPSGIYKITRLKTGEVYIGKSTDVKSRWQQHAKSCYNCGTISHSQLHTTMRKDGIQNFTFELLEEVPKDKLTEREKYWITFFDSKKFGLNEKVG